MLAVLGILCGCLLLAPPQQETVVRATAQEVLLDVVVRDSKGRFVRDLKPEEIEVSDEGAPQKLTGFRLITGKEQMGLTGEQGRLLAERLPLDPAREVRLVTLLFESVPVDQRKLARQAALDFLSRPLEQNVLAAVFIVSHRLHVLQKYTSDRDRLRTAVERATSGEFSEMQSVIADVQKRLDSVAHEGSTAMSAGAQGLLEGQPSPEVAASGGNSNAEAVRIDMIKNILGLSERIFRADSSRGTLTGLMAVVRGLAAMPGRKTVLYFAPGLSVTDTTTEFFKDTIRSASAAGVTVYAVDVRGLTTGSDQVASRRLLGQAGGAAKNQQEVQSETVQRGVSRQDVTVFDQAQDAIVANAQESMAALAESTGGRLIANTNDLRGPLRQLREEVLTYYELAYASPAKLLDGRFRRVSVKVKRPGTTVQTRAGYFALGSRADGLNAFETPLLHILNAAELPHAFPFRVAAIRFASPKYGLAIEVPLSVIDFTEELEKKRYRGHISFLLAVKDPAGEIVRRFSRDLGFYAPAADLEAYRKREFAGTFHLDLPPGRYTVDSAVLDRESMRASAQRATVTVAAPANGIAIGDITLVRQTEAEMIPADLEDPFHLDGNRIVPRLDPAFRRGADPALTFYAVLVPSPGTDKPEATVEVVKDGVVLTKSAIVLPAPDHRSRMRYIASLPLGALGIGTYELKITATQGGSAAESRTAFVIEP